MCSTNHICRPDASGLKRTGQIYLGLKAQAIACRRSATDRLYQRHTPMNKQDSVARLSKTDFEAALKRAQSTSEVRAKIQSLGWVARYAPAQRVRSVVNSAVEVARLPAEDAYASVMALAWPLRALQETNNSTAIPQVLSDAIEMSCDVSPTSSRTEALVLLIHAVLPAGIKIANPAIDALLAHCAGDDHWRIVRAFGDIALVVNSFDKTRAKKIAAAMPAGNKRDAAIARMEAGEILKVRAFYW